MIKTTWQKKKRDFSNLKKIILGLHKSFYGAIFLSIFFLSRNLEASTHHEESFEITGENILANHKVLKTSVDDCYNKIENNLKSYFDPGEKWEKEGGFDLKKGINLCAAGVEWVQKHNDKYYITELQPIISKTGKKLIFSNTSTGQWHNNIINDEYQILAWPYTKRLEVYDFNFFDEQKNIILNCFKNKKELRPTVYLSEILPNSLKNYKSYKDINILEKDIQNELSYTKRKYSLSLDKSIEEYNSLFKESNDPVAFIKKNEHLRKIVEDVDFMHSEPLVCWWVLKNLRPPVIKEGSKPLFPVISMYTERQTCSVPCEEIIQRAAKSKKYIPLISFNSEYEKNKYVLLQSNLLRMPEGSDFHVPYSTINPDLHMSLKNLENNLKISEPYTIDWTAIKAIHPSTTQLDELKERPWEKIVRFPIQFKL